MANGDKSLMFVESDARKNRSNKLNMSDNINGQYPKCSNEIYFYNGFLYFISHNTACINCCCHSK